MLYAVVTWLLRDSHVTIMWLSHACTGMFLSLSTVFMLDHFTRLSYLLIVCVCMVYRIHLLTRQSLVGVCWLRVICACRYSVCCMYGWIACLLCLIGLVRGGRFELRTFSFMMKGQCCASPIGLAAVQSSCLGTSWLSNHAVHSVSLMKQPVYTPYMREPCMCALLPWEEVQASRMQPESSHHSTVVVR